VAEGRSSTTSAGRLVGVVVTDTEDAQCPLLRNADKLGED
jgi:hypothetical protein